MSSRNCIDTGLTVSVSVLHSHFMGFNVISKQNLSFFVMIPFSSRVLCYVLKIITKKSKSCYQNKMKFQRKKEWEIFFVFFFSFSSSSSSSSWLQYSFRKAFLFWTKKCFNKKKGKFYQKKNWFLCLLVCVCVCKNKIFII